jgi:ferredoxin
MVTNMTKITLDRKQCIFCGLCIEVAPEAFEAKGEKSAVKDNIDFSNKKTMENVQMAVDACPVRAIKIVK